MSALGTCHHVAILLARIAFVGESVHAVLLQAGAAHVADECDSREDLPLDMYVDAFITEAADMALAGVHAGGMVGNHEWLSTRRTVGIDDERSVTGLTPRVRGLSDASQ